MMMDTLRNFEANKKKQARKELLHKIGNGLFAIVGSAVVLGFCWFMMSVAIIADQCVN